MSLAVVALLTAACKTQLTAVPAYKDEVLSGQVYYLPRVEYALNVEREITACEVDFETLHGQAKWLGEQTQSALAFSQRLDRFRQQGAQPACPEMRQALKKSEGLTDAFLDEAMHGLSCLEAPAEIDLAEQYARLREQALKEVYRQPELEEEATRAFFDQNELLRKAGAPLTQDTLEALTRRFQNIAPDYEYRVKVDVRVVSTPNFLPDMAHVHALQYQGMREGLRATNYKAEIYPNGTLKSLNVTLDDQTASVVQNSLQGVMKLSAAASGFPFSVAVPTLHSGKGFKVVPYKQWKKDALPNSPCTDLTQLHLRSRDQAVAGAESAAKATLEQGDAVVDGEAALAKQQSALDEKRKVLAALPATDPSRAGMAAAVDELAVAVEKSGKQLADDKKKLKGLQGLVGKQGELLAAARKRLTIASADHFAPDIGSPQLELRGADTASLQWFDPAAIGSYCSKEPCSGVGGVKFVPNNLRAYVAVYGGSTHLPDRPRRTGESLKKPGTNENAATAGALIYREPARALLRVCVEFACLGADGKPAAPAARILMTNVVDVPQFGVLSQLPLKNAAFQNNTLAASFAESGSLSTLSYTSNAWAAKAAEAFAGSAESYLQYRTAKRQDETERLKAAKQEVDAQAELVKSQAALLKEQQALEELNSTDAAVGEAQDGEDDGAQ